MNKAYKEACDSHRGNAMPRVQDALALAVSVYATAWHNRFTMKRGAVARYASLTR